MLIVHHTYVKQLYFDYGVIDLNRGAQGGQVQEHMPVCTRWWVPKAPGYHTKRFVGYEVIGLGGPLDFLGVRSEKLGTNRWLKLEVLSVLAGTK